MSRFVPYRLGIVGGNGLQWTQVPRTRCLFPFKYARKGVFRVDFGPFEFPFDFVPDGEVDVVIVVHFHKEVVIRVQLVFVGFESDGNVLTGGLFPAETFEVGVQVSRHLFSCLEE